MLWVAVIIFPTLTNVIAFTAGAKLRSTFATFAAKFQPKLLRGLSSRT